MILRDSQGHPVRLPDERWNHIIEDHPNIVEIPETIGETLQSPDILRRSNSDPDTVRLYYKRLPDQADGEKWGCVVVKYLNGDAFVLTAYITDSIREGEEI